MNRTIAFIFLVLVFAAGYFASRTLANPTPDPLVTFRAATHPPNVVASPASGPTFRAVASPPPNLTAPPPNIWVLQSQVEALRTQLQADEHTIASLQKQLTTFQHAFNSHVHTFSVAGAPCCFAIWSIPVNNCRPEDGPFDGSQCSAWQGYHDLPVLVSVPGNPGPPTVTETTSGPIVASMQQMMRARSQPIQFMRLTKVKP